MGPVDRADLLTGAHHRQDGAGQQPQPGGEEIVPIAAHAGAVLNRHRHDSSVIVECAVPGEAQSGSGMREIEWFKLRIGVRWHGAPFPWPAVERRPPSSRASTLGARSSGGEGRLPRA